MIVIFVSLSEKKARLKTQKVLDLYADRIGDQTWKTNITKEGLLAVKVHLARTASKNTAVACHWVHKSKNTELLWIVGSKARFTFDGIVPIATTKNNLLHNDWENDDQYLELIKCLVALAALFHDIGKSSDGFQQLLKGNKKSDIIRHEYISYLIFSRFTKAKTDEQWLTDFSQETFIPLIKNISNEIKTKGINFSTNESNSDLARLISYLIISHHKKPFLYDEYVEKNYLSAKCPSFEIFFSRYLNENWGYLKNCDNTYLNKFSKGIVFSKIWVKEVFKWSNRLLKNLNLFNKAKETNVFPLIITKSRLFLMLGDYYFSSQLKNDKYKEKTLKLFANTDKSTHTLKQYLEEHLIGVERESLSVIYRLNKSINSFPALSEIKSLRKSALKNSKYYWQDKASNKIKILSEEKKENSGFFCVNIASTGTGKTFANAKIINSITPNSSDLRFSIALGLRTLTLQTGDMYREKLHIDKTDLAVLIGSKAVEKLHELDEGDFDLEDAVFDDIDYANIIEDNALKTIIKSDKQNKMICAPVLISTIDHLMPACEAYIGGRWILPMIRLLTSDLIIDEIDDFSDQDLVCITRLVYTAGLLGRRVIISSATITPSISLGFYNSYIQGRSIYDLYFGNTQNIISCFVDEFSCKVFDTEIDFEMTVFKKKYEEFINDRIKHIKESEKNNGIKRKGAILEFPLTFTKEEVYLKILHSIEKLHDNNYVIDKKTMKRISIGVIRFAHIDTCAEFSKQLDSFDNDNIEIKFINYHSRNILLIRNEIERYLDKVLHRGSETLDSVIFEDNIINNHIENSKKKNIVFIVVSTSIEEVGRDHDFDWAIVEPSSYRSIIQLAGRVLRHRNKYIEEPNILILEYNLNSLKNDYKFVFKNPGYEISNKFKLKSHDLKQIIDEKKLQKSINSIPRLKISSNEMDEFINLEHKLIESYLLPNRSEMGPESPNGYYKGCWYLTGLPQTYSRFRNSNENKKIYILLDEDEQLNFYEKDEDQNLIPIKKTYSFEVENSIIEKSWLTFNYDEIIDHYSQKMNLSKNKIMNIYCYLEIPKKYIENKYKYSINFGMTRR